MRSKLMLTGLAAASIAAIAIAQQPKGPSPQSDSKAPPSSYMPVVETESFSSVVKRMKDNKKKVQAEHAKLLKELYDVVKLPASDLKVSRGKKVQVGGRV